MTNIRHWLVMTILCLSGGVIFLLPFLREVYYIPMQEAFGYNNTQLGIQMSVFGAASLLSYFPGGWIADRYSARKLITGATIAVGLGGFYFSTSPSYVMGILLHAYWGAAISLAFWGAMIKTTRNWAPTDEQGRAFGILEGGRGLSEVISSTIFLAVFAWLGSEADGLMRVIQLFAVTNILLGIAAWFILEDDEHSAQDVVKKVGLAEVKMVLKMPAVWLISLIVMTAYSAYWGTFYFTPYATDAFGLSVVIGGAIGVGKGWLKPLAAIGAGFLADKIGVATSVFGFFLILIFSFTVFSFLPGGEAFLIPMLINAVIVSMAVFALRGIYFALLEDGGVPTAVTGIAAGVVSAIGFTPDVFMPLIGGVLLDAYPGVAGYQILYGFIAVLCAAGAVAAKILMNRAVEPLPAEPSKG